MPTSRHRKKTSTKRKGVTKRDTLVEPITKIRIRRHRFPELRNNPDFLALVKVGRVVNAVTSGIHFISDYLEDMSPVGRRQYHRAIFMTGGYLFEGLELITSLRLKYINESYFQDLNALIEEPYIRHRKILQEMRHSVAFHLDSNDRSTKAALQNLRLPRYDLMSGDSEKIMDFYFDFSDTVDFNYLIDKFKGHESEDETVVEIIKSISDFMPLFAAAGHEFLTGLGEKMKFSEYVD